MTKNPILGIISAIQAGIPAVKEVFGLFKKKKVTDDPTLDGMSAESLKNHIKTLEGGDEQHILMRVFNLLITLGTVYSVIWLAHKLGVTYQDVIDLFGLIK